MVEVRLGVAALGPVVLVLGGVELHVEQPGCVGAIDRLSATGYDHVLEILEDFSRPTHPMAPDASSFGAPIPRGSATTHAVRR